MTDDTRHKLEIDWVKTLAGALAAVSSAVVLSTLGAAGTIIGAALGSVVITLGSALYSQGLARSRERLAQAQTAAMRKVGIAQAEVHRAGRAGDERAAESHLGHAEERLDEARQDLDGVALETATLGWRARLAVLPWRRLALLAAGLFVVAVLVITVFELIAGRSVSSITGGGDGGGTSLTHLTGGNDDDGEGEKDPGKNGPDDPSDDASPTEGESESPSSSPSGSASTSETPSESTTSVPTTPATPSSGEPTLPTESPTASATP